MTMKERIQSVDGNVLEHFGFNVCLAGAYPEEIVCMMIVDDGNDKPIETKRSRRKNLFNDKYTRVCVAVEEHKTLDWVIGMCYVKDFFNNDN